jgi:hypothetical protein
MRPGFFIALIILTSALNAVETPAETPPDLDTAESVFICVPGGKPQRVPQGETATAVIDLFHRVLSGDCKPMRQLDPDYPAFDLYVSMDRGSQKAGWFGCYRSGKYVCLGRDVYPVTDSLGEKLHAMVVALEAEVDEATKARKEANKEERPAAEVKP